MIKGIPKVILSQGPLPLNLRASSTDFEFVRQTTQQTVVLGLVSRSHFDPQTGQQSYLISWITPSLDRTSHSLFSIQFLFVINSPFEPLEKNYLSSFTINVFLH